MFRPNRPSFPGDRLLAAFDWSVAAFVRRFEVDLRALAALRIGLGTLILADLLLRVRSLVAFHADAGVLPLTGWETYYSNDLTIHTLSGDAWFQAVLFVIAGLFAVSLLVGYRTRTVTVVSWLLVLSLHGRNPLVLNSGDTLLRMLLFWGMFVPLGERWSVDARRDGSRRGTVATVATVALLVQVVLVYVVNSLHKLSSDEWLSGEAVVYVMQLDHFSILLGDVVADYPPLLRVVTFVWLVLVTASPLLLVLTGRKRAAFATAFVGMHLGMVVTMKIGLFPLVSVASLLPFYPPVLWNAVERRASDSGYVEWLGDRLDRLAAVLPSPDPGHTLHSYVSVDLPSARPLFSTIVPWLFLTFVLLSNAYAVNPDDEEPPQPARELLEDVEADQSWQMFAPNPLTETRWYVVPGSLTDGTQVDAFHGGEVDWDPPPDAADTYPSARWRKYMGNVHSLDHTDVPSYFANYLCDRWNRTHDTRLATLRLVVVSQPGTPYGPPADTSREVIQAYDCSGDLVQA